MIGCDVALTTNSCYLTKKDAFILTSDLSVMSSNLSYSPFFFVFFVFIFLRVRVDVRACSGVLIDRMESGLWLIPFATEQSVASLNGANGLTATAI